MYESGMFGPDAALSADEVLRRLPQLEPVSSEAGVAEKYRLPGALGCVGLIRPVSRPFCGECSRIRLTADGKLKPCLHSSAEISVKGLGLDEMTDRFKKAILAKPARHGGLDGEKRSAAGRSMNAIGG